jgi:hypothetical protein
VARRLWPSALSGGTASRSASRLRQPGKTALRFDPDGWSRRSLYADPPNYERSAAGFADRRCDLRSDRREAPRSAPFLSIQRSDSTRLAARDAVPPRVAAPPESSRGIRPTISAPAVPNPVQTGCTSEAPIVGHQNTHTPTGASASGCVRAREEGGPGGGSLAGSAIVEVSLPRGEPGLRIATPLPSRQSFRRRRRSPATRRS